MSENPSSADVPREHWLKRTLKFLLKISIAAGIMVYLILVHGESIGKAFVNINWLWLIPAVLLYALHLTANAWRWWILLKAQKIRCSLWTAISLTFQSFFFSLVMPGGAIGGDLVRAGFLAARIPKGRKFDGIFTILIDRFTGMIGIFAVAIGMLPFTWWCLSDAKGSDGGNVVLTFIYCLLAGAAAGLLASVIMFRHHDLERLPGLSALIRFGDRVTHGMYTRVSEALDSYRTCRKELAICILSSIVFVNLVLGVEAYCVALSVAGPDASFSGALAAITVGNIAGLLPLTPSGIGARDFFVIPILAASGMAGDQALAVTLLLTLLIVLFNFSGGLFFIFTKNLPPDQEEDR